MQKENMNGAWGIAVADLEALTAFDTPTIANAMESLDIRGFASLGPEVRALTPVQKPVVGLAVTATMGEMCGGKFAHLEGWMRFLEVIERTSLPVVAIFHDASAIPGREAMIGEGMSLAMSVAGAVGAIADGCLRDIAALRSLDFPAFGKGLTCDRGLIRFRDHQVPVRVGGMHVVPGDLIHADENGAVVVPVDRLKEIAQAAAAVAAKEAGIFEMMRAPDYCVERLREFYAPALTAAVRER